MSPFERKNLRERLRDFAENRQKYANIIKAWRYMGIAFLALAAIQLVAYYGFLNSSMPGFLGKYGLWLLYLDVSIASIGGAVWYMNSERGHVTCMTGMMIGMTVAMQAGMMVGAVVGATNGFFIGSLVGVTTAVIAGTLTGAMGGAMGAVQGLMSGIMAGTMGPMISVMMFTDNLSAFMPYYMLLNLLVLAGLVYIYFEEVIEGRDVRKRPQDLATFASVCLLITAVITAIMIYGPKSPLFA